MSSNLHQLSTRRHFLAQNAMGIGGVALAWLLQREGLLAKPVKPDLTAASHTLLPKQPHHKPRAKAMRARSLTRNRNETCPSCSGSDAGSKPRASSPREPPPAERRAGAPGERDRGL